MRRTIQAILIALLAAAPAGAQEVGAAQREALSARVAEFDAAMATGDMGELLGFTPPPVRAALAELAGLTEEELVEALRAATADVMADATIQDFGMDVEAATVATTPDGSRIYLLVPTVTDIAVEARGLWRSTSQTLAFEDGGEWWLVRMEDPEQAIVLARVYPEFAGVTFPTSVTEPVE